MTRRSVLLVHFTPPGVVGGVESILDQHRALLRARGFTVQVLAGREGDADFVLPAIDAARPENAAIEQQLAAGVVSPEFIRARESVAAALQELSGDFDFLIVHNAFTLHFSLPLSAALWEIAATRPPGRTIAWSHDLSWTNPLYLPTMHAGYPWDLLRLRAPHTRYVAISEQRAAELRELWGDPGAEVAVVPNGVDANAVLRLSPWAQSLAARFRLFDRDLVMLLPVRITRRKNIELGMRVTHSLKQLGRDVCFLVSGPLAPHHPGRAVTYLEELKVVRQELHLEGEVVFLADALGTNLTTEQVYELYALSDALLFLSSQEGFGLPVLEAGLARVPLILSDIPIFREVGAGNAWTFSLTESTDTIARGVATALDNGPSRQFRRVLRDARWDVIMERDVLPLLSG